MASQYFVRAKGGPEAGPMSGVSVRNLVRSGELGSNDLIRTDTSAKWMTIASVPQLAAELPKPPAPPPDELGLNESIKALASTRSAQVDSSGDEDAPPKLKTVDVTTLLLLSAVTLGIYGMIWFFGVIKSYRGITKRKEPNIELLFWIYLGCMVAGGVLLFVGIGILILIGGVVVGAILLDNVLKDRSKIVNQVGGVKGLGDRGLLLGLWIAGQVVSFILIGVPMLLYQAHRFATDHNRIVKACQASHPEWVQGPEDPEA